MPVRCLFLTMYSVLSFTFRLCILAFATFKLCRQILPTRCINVTYDYLEGGDGSSEEDRVHAGIQSDLEGKCLLSLAMHPTFADCGSAKKVRDVWGLRSESSLGSIRAISQSFHSQFLWQSINFRLHSLHHSYVIIFSTFCVSMFDLGVLEDLRFEIQSLK
jgi:hypothetical protein